MIELVVFSGEVLPVEMLAVAADRHGVPLRALRRLVRLGRMPW